MTKTIMIARSEVLVALERTEAMRIVIVTRTEIVIETRTENVIETGIGIEDAAITMRIAITVTETETANMNVNVNEIETETESRFLASMMVKMK